MQPTLNAANAAQNTTAKSGNRVLNNIALASALDAVLENAIKQQRLVGSVVLVAHQDTLVYRKAAGHADREQGLAMEENTIFRLASVTKAFTTLAAAVLLQRGKMRLDDPVTRWLPDFTPRLPNGTESSMTIRHLLSHTAGLNYGAFEAEDGPYHRAGVCDGLEETSVSQKENLQRLASVPLLFEPGTSWQYSLATDVLGEVVAEVSGFSLPEAIRELVTSPLGMKDTGFTVTDRSRLARPYYNAEPHPLPMGEEEYVSFEGMKFHYSPGRSLDPTAPASGGASMVGTAHEVLRLLETIRRGGAPLVSPELMHLMNRNHVGNHRAAPGTGFGLGWAVLVDPEEAQSPQSPGTLSWGGVYGHSWFVDPVQNLSVLILTNTALEGIFGQTAAEIRDAIYAYLP